MGAEAFLWRRLLARDDVKPRCSAKLTELFARFVPQANLNDSHNQMVVHWAGEKSNVIVALARDSAGSTGPKTSSVRPPQRSGSASCGPP